MALNQIFPDDRKSRRARPVGNDVAPGTAIINGGKPAVTITGSRDYDGNAITAQGNGLTIVLAGGKGGESLPADDYATISFTGTYGWPVAGATIATKPGTPVYLEADGDLTLTEGTNEPYGVVEFFRGKYSATDTAVTIGA